ncbi:MAG: AAA family ATPase, partial [Thermoguttaceae bacterium]
MRISNATLSSYGIFRNRRVEFDETQSIFLAHGRNEGGKSTLLSFMRNMLFGYAKTTGEYAPFSKNERYVKGRLDFLTQDARRGAIERVWEQGGDPELEFSARLDGGTLTREELTAFLGGGMVNRDFFANFFGISYREIATGESRLTSKKLSET